MSDISFRPAQQGDAPGIAQIHTASWRDAYRPILDPAFLEGPIENDRYEHWKNKMEAQSENSIIELALNADRCLIGFIMVEKYFDLQWGSFVDNLHVLPEVRGYKIGENLLRLSARRILSGALYLWVFEYNSAAVRFYERLGGRVVEKSCSKIPAANKKNILRLHWPNLSPLL